MYPNTNYAHEINNNAICIFNLCVKKLKACLCIKKADWKNHCTNYVEKKPNSDLISY